MLPSPEYAINTTGMDQQFAALLNADFEVLYWRTFAEQLAETATREQIDLAQAKTRLIVKTTQTTKFLTMK